MNDKSPSESIKIINLFCSVNFAVISFVSYTCYRKLADKNQQPLPYKHRNKVAESGNVAFFSETLYFADINYI